MSNEEPIQQQLEAAQIQIQQLSQQITAAQDAARQTQAHLEQQQQQLAQLTAQNQRLWWIVNTSPAITYTCEAVPPYTCTSISQSLELTLGYAPAEFRSEPDFWAQHLHPDDAPRVFAGIPALFEQGRLLHEYRLRHRDGHYVWVRDELTLLRDAQGVPQEIVGFLADISDRKHTEQLVAQELQHIANENQQFRQTLTTQEITYRHLFDCNPQPMWVFDLETLQFLAVNDAAIAKYGYSRAEFLAMTIADIRPPEDLPRLLETVAQVTSGLDRAGTWQHCLRDGQIIHVEITSHTLEFSGRRAELVLAQDVSDRLHVEQALRHSEERYRLLVELAPLMMWSADAAGLNTYASTRMSEYIGLPTEQLMAFDWEAAIHPDDQQRVHDRWMQSVQTKIPYEVEYRLRRADGEYRWHLIRAICVEHDPDIQWLGMSTEIHDRKQAQLGLQDLNQTLEQTIAERTAELRRSQGQLAAILQYSPSVIYSKDLSGRHLFVNQAFLDLFNCQWTDIIGKTDAEFFDAAIAAQLRSHDQALLAQGSVQQFEETLPIGNTQRVFLSSKFILRTDQGEPYGICGISTDITDRKHTEIQLKQQLATIEAAIDGIGITQDNIFTYVNRAQLEMFGYTPAELIGQPWTILYSADELARMEREVVPILMRDRAWQGEVTATRKDGSTFAQDLSLTITEDGLTICVSKDISDRKHAERALRESQHMLQTVLDATPIPIFWKDRQLVYQGMNVVAAHNLGCESVNECVGLADRQLPWHQEDAQMFEASDRQILASGQPLLNQPYHLYLQDGTELWIECSKVPLRDAAGNIIGILGTSQDITDRKQAELALKESEQRYVTLAQAAPVGIFRFDLEGNCIYVNEGWCKMTGKPAALALNNRWMETIHPDDREPTQRAIQQWVQSNSETPFQHEARILRDDGRIVWFYCQMSFETNANGQAIGYVGTLTDITDQKQTELTLQTLSDRLIMSLQAGAFGNWEWDLDQEVVWDARMYEIFGLQDLGRAVTHQDWCDRVHPDDRVRLEANLPALLNGEISGNLEYRIYHPNGELHWVQGVASIQYNADGKPTRIFGLTRDNTDRKQAEIDLQTLSDRLTLALQAGGYGIWEWNLAGELIWDDHMYAIHGLPNLGQVTTYEDWRVLVHPDDIERVEALTAPALTGEVPFTVEFRIQRPDGELRWLQSVAQVQRDRQGTPIRMVGINCDITNRKQAELTLQTLSDRLTLALQAGGYGIWEWNLDGELIWDDRMYTINGLPNLGQVATYEDWHQLVHPDDIERIEAHDALALGSDSPFNTEYRIIRPDGELRWLQSVAQVQHDRQGTPIRMVGINCDITNRKQAELALRRSEEELRLFINASSDIVYRVSADWQELQSLDGKNFISSTTTPMRSWLQTYIPSEDQHRVWAAIQKAIATKRPFESEHRVVQQNGAIGWTFTRAIPMLDEQGAIIEWFGTASDITQRKQAELDLIEYAEQVEDLYNNAPCGYCSLDRDSRITQINNTALRWLDYTRETVLGQPITQFLAASSRQTFTERYAMLTQADAVRSLEYEMTLMGSDGGHMAVLVSEAVQKDAGGSFIGSRITITDIRQRLRAERLVQQRLTQENLLRQITARIRQSLDIATIFDTACQEVRQALHADRVAIFRFYLESNYRDGEFIAESIVGDYPSVVAVPIHDYCFGDNFASLYAHGRYHAVADIEAGEISACHADILRQFQVRANLIVPLLDGDNALWGLLCIHQCNQPRAWQTPEIDLVQQLATQLAIALNQASLYQRIQSELAVRQHAEAQVLRQLEKQRTLARLIETVRESLAVDDILNTVTQQVKDLLQCDRVIIFRLDPDGHSRIVEEAVAPEFATLKDMQWDDEVWSDEILQHYWQGRPRIVPDVRHDVWTDCLIDYSQAGQIQSKIVAPILQEPHTSTPHRWVDPSMDNQLWGILVAHACRERRVWHEPEAELLQQIANSVAIAIQQASLFAQLQQQLRDRQQAEQQLAIRNQQLSLSNAELERATRLKDEFLANMSHELRTPLNAILGMTEGLQEEVFGPINERQHHSLTTIETSGNHLLSLINDVLDVAKIEAGQFDLDYEIVSVRRLCDSSLTLVKQQAHKKQLHLETHFANPLPDLYADERRLRQILVNLLSNAVKFTPDGGRITITTTYTPLTPEECRDRSIVHPQADPTATQGILTLAVNDTGIGISPENTPKLFQPFIQIDSALNRQHEGTGLGLALVKRITEMHGGQVELTSTVGSGSCFTIHLPVISVSANGVTIRDCSVAVASPTDLAPIAIPLILLAEDNIANVNTTAAYLTAKGYRLIVAKNGMEAINLATTSKPDLILMDVQMPQMDGLEAMRQIRQDPDFATVPIIAMTALAMPEDRDRCLAAGATDYLSKPIRLRHLAQMIQTLLTSPH